MSKSYSEIVQSPSRFKIEPVTESEEAMLHQEGTVLKEGDMVSTYSILCQTLILYKQKNYYCMCCAMCMFINKVHFIAKNLETKIRLSSPDISGKYLTT